MPPSPRLTSWVWLGWIRRLTVTDGGQVNAGSSAAFGVLRIQFRHGLGIRLRLSSRVDTTLFLGYFGDGTLSVASGGTVSAPTVSFATAGGSGTAPSTPAAP